MCSLASTSNKLTLLLPLDGCEWNQDKYALSCKLTCLVTSTSWSAVWGCPVMQSAHWLWACVVS